MPEHFARRCVPSGDCPRGALAVQIKQCRANVNFQNRIYNDATHSLHTPAAPPAPGPAATPFPASPSLLTYTFIRLNQGYPTCLNTRFVFCVVRVCVRDVRGWSCVAFVCVRFGFGIFFGGLFDWIFWFEFLYFGDFSGGDVKSADGSFI